MLALAPNVRRKKVSLAMILMILAFGGLVGYWLLNGLSANHSIEHGYVLVGGQHGNWFEMGQTPELYRVTIPDLSIEAIAPVSDGAVWTGDWNGSQWLISGWGAEPGAQGSNPYIYLYDGENAIGGDSLKQYENEATWHGGDIFGATYNGSDWLVSGLGSGALEPWTFQANHMGLALFDGRIFSDLSPEIPNQWDAPLFANGWNGHYWLVGGGWEGNEGELLKYEGSNLTDLSEQFESIVSFQSVQTIQWNGNYWLIGGVGFLMKYDGQNLTNLTPQLNEALLRQNRLSTLNCCNSVNALAWNGSSWAIGGGAPVANTQPLRAWSAEFDGTSFKDTTAALPSNVAKPNSSSSILSITWTDGSWFFGGYADDRGMLFSLKGTSVDDLSYLVNNAFTSVNWVGGLSRPAEVRQTNQTAQSSQSMSSLGVILIPGSKPTIKFGETMPISLKHADERLSLNWDARD